MTKKETKTSKKENIGTSPNKKKQSRADGRVYYLVPPVQNHPKPPRRPAPVTVKNSKQPESTSEEQM